MSPAAHDAWQQHPAGSMGVGTSEPPSGDLQTRTARS
eukprot:CAMPEP_0117697416 /NCGR_PEP_ID=MMETSP0804-20121206/29221_1 /TAXON_ID=1074897 /ORGANISM="Tetraselmis astigmatica, Strain CCMP880" /LENGTH=36 /DNA_ID= /DNA_START= /DNA_END= /DNA_ORIENTATION=